MTLEEIENQLQPEEVKRQEEYIKLDLEQLHAIMAAILVAGKCFQDQNSRSVYQACRVAEQIIDRIIHNQEYTEYEGGYPLAGDPPQSD